MSHHLHNAARSQPWAISHICTVNSLPYLITLSTPPFDLSPPPKIYKSASATCTPHPTRQPRSAAPPYCAPAGAPASPAKRTASLILSMGAVSLFITTLPVMGLSGAAVWGLQTTQQT